MSKIDDTPRCEVSVSDGGIWPSFHKCCNKGKVQVDGKWYCGIHDPAKQAERDAKRKAKYDAEMDKWRKGVRAKACFNELVAVVEDGVNRGIFDDGWLAKANAILAKARGDK